MATYTISTVFKAIDRVSKPFRMMSNSAKSFGAKIDRIGGRFNTVFSGMGAKTRQLLNTLGLISGISIAGMLGGDAVRTIIDFEQGVANLGGVLGKSATEISLLTKDAERLGATTSKTATEVLGLQEAYARLGFGQKEILNLTEATINGSVALRGDLAETAELTGAVVRTFKNLSTTDAPQILDQMTLATQKSALNFEKLQVALPIVSGAANAAGLSFSEVLSLLGKLSDAGIDTSTSATALRNIFIESASKGLSYEKILQKIANSQDKLTSANDEFGKRAAVSSLVLAENLKATSELNDVLNSAATGQKNAGVAAKVAAQQLDTLGGRLTVLGSAWEGFVLSIDNGTGSLGMFAKRAIEVATEILSIFSGTQKAASGLTEAEKSTRFWAKTVIFLVKAFVAYKAIMITATAVTTAYNTVKAISLALEKGNMIYLRGSRFALLAYVAIQSIASAAQWLWNGALTAYAVVQGAATAAAATFSAVLSANPIGAVVIAILALIAVVVLVTKHFDEWGAGIIMLAGPLGYVINLVASFARHWDKIVDSFKNGGILEGIKSIGLALLDAVLYPLQQILQLASNIPGLGGLAATGADSIAGIREKLELINPEVDKERNRTIREEKTERQLLDINLNNNTNNDVSFGGNSNVTPTLSPTFTY